MKISVFSNELCFAEFFAGEYLNSKFKITPQSGNTVIKMSLPLVDIHGVWRCNSSEFQLRLPWNVTFSCALNRGMPFLAFFNSARVLSCAVATDNLIDDTDFSAALNQQNCTYDITLTVTGTAEFTLTVDRRGDIPFTESLRQWREEVMPAGVSFPAAAWEPVFCTWYAVHGAVTQKWIERQAIKAKALGFSTLIVDDGWCYDESKRVTPETLPNWYNTIGDWKISTEKFPDFPGHVKKIQNIGLKYLLWTAPHFMGVDSELFRLHPEWCFDDFREGCRHLDVRNSEAVDFIAEKLISLVADNELDGLKIDFLDVIPPGTALPVGRNTKTLIEKLFRGLRAVKPDALIEFRQGYATIGMLPYGTQFRAGDVPFDWAYNFRRLADIRLSVGDNVPVHADPAYWAPDEYPENVARHMMVMLMAVPMLSMDLNELPAEHLSIVQYYLKLYHAKQQLLNHGHWQIYFGAGDVAAVTVSSDDEAVVFINDSTVTGKLASDLAGKKVTLLNISADAVKVGTSVIDPGCDGYFEKFTGF